MVTKDRAVHMIEKIKERIEKCEPMSQVLLVQTSEFIQDAYNDNEIDMNVYNELRYTLRTVANQFPLKCSCTKKI